MKAIVIGGGVSGLAIARTLSERGLTVSVLERDECCKGTSNNSLRVVHGGFRYLQSLDFRRLVTSLRDQTEVMHEFSDLVIALPCYMALNGSGLKSRWPIEAASRLYALFMLQRRSPLRCPRYVSPRELGAALQDFASKGALLWYDALLLDPLELGRRLRLQAEQCGATVLENHTVISVDKTSSGFCVQDVKGRMWEAECVINAAGPWVRDVTFSGIEGSFPRVEWCKGFNVVVRNQLDPENAIAFESSSGRLFFVTPRGSGSAIGTWYAPAKELLRTPSPSEAELEQFIKEFNLGSPNFKCEAQDIVGFDCGYLPMQRDGPRGPELFGSEIVTPVRGYVEVLSTKYTTFRSQAERVSRLALQSL